MSMRPRTITTVASFAGSVLPGSVLDSPVELTPTELLEQRSQWLHQLFSENPQLLALRERLLPWTGGYSFANVVHSDRAAVPAHVNRHTVLELVYQHLHSIGMHLTAESIREESGHSFQNSDQPWNATDLLQLVSLGVLPTEDAWTMPEDPHHQFLEENLEVDFFASSYREDPHLLLEELLDPSLRVEYSNAEVHNLGTIKLASLRRLVVFLCSEEKVFDEDIQRFFMILTTITSSRHFVEHIITLFDCLKLLPADHESYQNLAKRQDLLRMSVINIIKKWIGFQGLFIGLKAIKLIAQFIRRIIEDTEDDLSKFARFARPILESLPRLKYGTKSGQLNEPEEQPEIPDPQILFRPNLTLIDPTAVEVARQITLIFHAAFKAVHSREFMVALGTREESYRTPTLAEFFEFGPNLTRLALETIVTAPDKNQAVAQLHEIAVQLGHLSNYDAMSCVLRALLKTELCALPFLQQPAIRDSLAQLTAQCGEDWSNQEPYQAAIQDHYQKWLPAIPNVRTELRLYRADQSPSFIGGLINWEKRWNDSAETAKLYRFQARGYSFWPIPQIQKVLFKGPSLTQDQLQEKLRALSQALSK
jgi:hypothetical protein